MPARENQRQPCTILLPLFNGSAFLSRSISNLCEIAGHDDEILVIDDGSTDITDQEIKSIIQSDSRIVFHKCQHIGLVETLNYGIRHAANEFIARADVDDIYTKNRIELQVKFLTDNSQVLAVFSDYRMVTADGRQVGIFPCAISSELTAFSLLSSQRTAHSSVMYRKSSVQHAGGYLSKDFPAEDLALWLRLIINGEIASIPQVLLDYTVHGQSITQLKQQAMREKSFALRHQYAIKENWTGLLSKASTLLSAYSDVEKKHARTLFFINDLLTLNELTQGHYKKRICKIILKQVVLKNILLFPALWEAATMKFRKLILSSK